LARVVVGLSGGVDSSVAAALLKEQGHEVIGVFMKNWHDTSVTISDECPWEEDSNDALLVAEKLGIPFQTLDLSEAYKEKIVDYMFREYEQGRTPNPDVLCNREIKFDVFLNAAMKLGADYVATGHYCQKGETLVNGKKVYRLLAGADANKDQSYFLCQINQSQLSKALFPIGHLQKKEVRRLAEERDLVTSGKRDSQGLCFIGKVKLPTFLQQQLEPQEGNVVLLSKEPLEIARHDEDVLREGGWKFQESHGKTIGKHQGAHFYTIGQRKGLGIGGFKEPLFVVGLDTETNSIYVGEGEEHWALHRKDLLVKKEECHWLRDDLELGLGGEASYKCRIRYRQELQNATLVSKEKGLVISFDKPQKAIARGQFVAWYLDDELVGSGVIS
jgi:tRNA-specific 2-thiouridylase